MLNTTLFFLAQATSGGSAAPGPRGGLGDMLIPLLCFGVIFYFLLIRPQQKKQKEHNQLLGNLKTNDEVVTSGGIHGRIANVKETTFILKIADNVKVEIDKSAIARVTKSTTAAPAEKAS